MSRTYVITGSASGIGHATAALLTERGHRVIGVDVHDADVIADLSRTDGRDHLVQQVTDISGGAIDAVIANAGLASPTAATVAVNYFGAVATLDRLRPLLAGSPAPRAAATLSGASLLPPDDALLAAMRAGDEPAALARGRELETTTPAAGNPTYQTTKRALAQWIRRQAPTQAWASAGIPLNAIAPGFVATPLVASHLQTDEVQRLLPEVSPLNGVAQPRQAAYLLAWLTSEENTHLAGQVIFIDGGVDVTTRGDSVW